MSAERHELVIVGGGPAGLSAAVHSASEGIETLLVDGKDQFGGQAGTSTLIENYPAFPEGITGEELTSRMVDQALKFNVTLEAPLHVDEVEATEDGLEVRDDREAILGRAVLVSSGVEYRRHRARNLAGYLRRGVTYGSPRVSSLYEDKKLFVVGGANSAGQAAMHLSQATGCTVHMLVRGDSIEERMSAYLAKRVQQAPNIEVHTRTELKAVDGDEQLRKVVITQEGQEVEMDADKVYLLIGAVPMTKWLPSKVARDEYGFIQVGGDLPDDVRECFVEECGRQPYAHETSVPGMFVVGDVRSGSIKRVASAVGEGGAVVSEIHRHREEHEA